MHLFAKGPFPKHIMQSNHPSDLCRKQFHNMFAAIKQPMCANLCMVISACMSHLFMCLLCQGLSMRCHAAPTAGMRTPSRSLCPLSPDELLWALRPLASRPQQTKGPLRDSLSSGRPSLSLHCFNIECTGHERGQMQSGSEGEAASREYI